MRKIIIAGSSKFYKEALDLKTELEKNNYEVIDYTKKIDEEKEYKYAYETFYKNINKTDDLLVLNMDKNNIEGYIGYETFAEMSYLIANNIITNNNNRKIFLYKIPSKKLGCYDEIMQFLKLGYIQIYK